jgi:hypothetical protein
MINAYHYASISAVLLYRRNPSYCGSMAVIGRKRWLAIRPLYRGCAVGLTLRTAEAVRFTSTNAPPDDRLPNSRGAVAVCRMIGGLTKLTPGSFMHGWREIAGTAGGAKPGVMRMYKGLHNGVVYVMDKRSDTNGLLSLNCVKLTLYAIKLNTLFIGIQSQFDRADVRLVEIRNPQARSSGAAGLTFLISAQFFELGAPAVCLAVGFSART